MNIEQEPESPESEPENPPTSGIEILPEQTSSADDGVEPDAEEAEPEFGAPSGPPVKLERLQKILAQAGIASRRHAEQLIIEGRVQVNGAIVKELGSKADAGRDHIRVDGKLLHGPERLRYYMLNKPKGFVTTVKDPEGRPTVMQFFQKTRERLYPVGRLDYQSEGLLLVTNDGELANKLTRAASGVEKTYLVKVSGQPTEAELDILRQGVSIEKGRPGSDQVRTAAAKVRQVRQGDNPWYEVVLIEGRNRELRKMFEEIGHFVEKIRRVGYGPLVLDVEPGKLRELEPRELDLLRKAAEGKLKTHRPKIVDSLREVPAARPGKSVAHPAPGPAAPRGTKPPQRKDAWRAKPEFRPRPQGPASYGEKRDRSFAPKPQFDRPERGRSGAGETRSASSARPAERRPFPGKFSGSRPQAGPTGLAGQRPPRASSGFGNKPRPAGARDTGFAGRGDRRPSTGSDARSRPGIDRGSGARPGPRPAFRDQRPAPEGRPRFERPQSESRVRFEKPAQSSRQSSERPPFRERPREGRAGSPSKEAWRKPFRPSGPPTAGSRPATGARTGPPTSRGGKPPYGDRPRSSSGPRPGGSSRFGASARPSSAGGARFKPSGSRPGSPRPSGGRSSSPRPGNKRSGGPPRSGGRKKP